MMIKIKKVFMYRINFKNKPSSLRYIEAYIFWLLFILFSVFVVVVVVVVVVVFVVIVVVVDVVVFSDVFGAFVAAKRNFGRQNFPFPIYSSLQMHVPLSQIAFGLHPLHF